MFRVRKGGVLFVSRLSSLLEGVEGRGGGGEHTYLHAIWRNLVGLVHVGGRRRLRYVAVGGSVRTRLCSCMYSGEGVASGK